MRGQRAIGQTLCAAGLLMLGVSGHAAAQTIGPFSWQLLPYCNVVTIRVTQVGSGPVFRLEGTDDQCGAGTLAPVIGIAAFNPDGTIELGLSHITTPGGVAVHVDAAIILASLNGTWRDSTGHNGPFIFTVGAGIGGNPRPVGVPGADITSVAAGAGLTGGSASGEVTLNVSFGGPGAATTVARSDHQHERGGSESLGLGLSALAAATGAGNIAIGHQALQSTSTGLSNVALGVRASQSNTTGNFNTAIGHSALRSNTVSSATAVGAFALASNTTGCCNSALGLSALASNATGAENTALGFQALALSTSSFNTGVGSNALFKTSSGSSNTGVGASALLENTTGANNVAVGDSALRQPAFSSNNTAVGHHALMSVTTGTSNIAIGSSAGTGISTGSSNILIGHTGSPTDSGAIRIGQSGLQDETYISGITGATSPSGVTVLINAGGKLGTSLSSRRFKENVAPILDARRIVQALKPITFHYKPEYDDGSRIRQYGLIAEDALEVEPNLVVMSEDGQAQTVRYHLLAPLLLAEVHRLERERVAQDETMRTQARELRTLREELATLKAWSTV